MHIKFTKIKRFFSVLTIIILGFSFFSTASAQTVTQFNNNLYWNIQPIPHPEVKFLQQFLKDQGLYAGEINGSFLTQTYDSVMAFQKKYGITPVSGYFGPDSRSVANKILSGSAVQPTSTMVTQTTAIVVPANSPTPTPTTQTTSVVSTDNLIYNPSLEEINGTKPNRWSTGRWGTNTAVFKYPVTGVDGARGANVTMTAYTDGDAKWFFEDVLVTPGKKYTFTEKYKSNVVTNVTIRWKKTDGTYYYQSLATPTISNTWTQRSNIITVPTGVVSMTIFHLIKSVGTLDIDSYKLSVYVAPLAVNATVSAWGNWIPVSAWSVCVNNTQTRTEERTRTVVTLATNGGTMPSLKELRIVSQACISVTPVATSTTSSQGTIPTPTTSTTTSAVSTTTKKVLQWGAYVGDSSVDLTTFENLVGKQANIRSVFYGFSDNFPMQYTTTIGAKGKTLLLFWEPSFGYDSINDGSKDALIRKFAQDAKTYGFPVMLSPFHEMNGNWSPWGYGKNNNTGAKFITSWRRIYNIFKEVGTTNVKFAMVYNAESVPNVVGNQYNDYYPGGEYVDYVGVDGFNFGTPWRSFKTIFEGPVGQLSTYKKPIYIFSMGSVPGPEKDNWILDALGSQIYNYPIEGWVWFNQHAFDGNWLIDSDQASLEAFRKVIPN